MSHIFFPVLRTGYIFHGDHELISQGDFQWGQARSADMMISLQWFYDQVPRLEFLENQFLLKEGNRFDWTEWYTLEHYIKGDLDKVPRKDLAGKYPFFHGVNVAQGLKAPAVIRRFTHEDHLIDTARRAVEWTFEFHGAASGTILADERLAGLRPNAGSELCTTVELIYSLSYLYSAFAESQYADRAELVTFNAFPSGFTEDYWAHQYVTQPNQLNAGELPSLPFSMSTNWPTVSVLNLITLPAR